MKTTLKSNDQFGPDGPQRGAPGEIIDWFYGGPWDDTMFLVRFDGFDGEYWCTPMIIGVLDTSGTYTYWRG